MKRQPRVILWLVAALCLLAACGVPADEEPSVPPTAAPEAVFSGLRELPGDGLTHDPYGWDNLYGSKEVPVVWWQREPRDGMAGQQTQINVAVGKALAEKDVWIAWAKNGERMEDIPCRPRANLQADGVEKIKYCGAIPSLKAGERVEYMVCAGAGGTAERSVGPFAFTAAQWERVELLGAADTKEASAAFLGKAQVIPVTVRAEIQEGKTLSLRIENGSGEAVSPMPEELAEGTLRFVMDKDGSFTLKDQNRVLIAGKGIEVLTDGETVRRVRLTVAAEPSDRFYGFGMKYDALDQRGRTVENYCVNWYKDQQGETYTPVPYYFVPDRYGLFVDSTYFSSFAMAAQGREDTCVIEIDTGGTGEFSVPVYLFAGNNRQIADSYAAVAGRAVLPPVWAFGPWISANEWDRQSEIAEQLEQTVEQKIATTVVVIEAWSDEQTFYVFNDAKFEAVDGSEALKYEDFTFTGRWPDPKGMVEALHENGIRCVLWQIPVLKYSAEATVQSMRDQNYAVRQGYVLKYADGGTYRLPGGTWFGNSLLVDFTSKDAAAWFLEKRRYLLEDVGIDGFKTDGGEFVWGRDVVAADGTRGDELRNAYPDLYAQAYYDFGNDVAGEAVTFSRAGGSSMQTHPLCWVGDQNSDFAAFRSAIRATLSASMSGIPFVAWDIAGFSGDVPAAELYQRSVAQAAFSPVMQLHSETAGDPQPSQARTPWNMAQRKGDGACLETYRYYANLRMNLLPYIYTEAKWSSETGEPMMRSMAYAFPEDERAAGYEFQYMFGRNMLVAPVTAPNAKRVNVYLPEGVWYNFFTGERYEGGTYSVPAAVNEIPVFVREGTIIPVNVDESGELATYVGNGCDAYRCLRYIVFPGKGEYTWYDYVAGREVDAVFDGEVLTADGVKNASYLRRGGSS